MDLCQMLFDETERLARSPHQSLPDPTRRTVQGAPIFVGPRKLPTYLLYGSERQFHRWTGAIRHTVLSTAFDYRAGIPPPHLQAGLADHLARFFRSGSDLPALIWTSPVWVRTVNWAVREELRRDDETLPVTRYGLRTTGPVSIPVQLGPTETFEVYTQGDRCLWFRYPEPERFFLRVPRRRGLYHPDGSVLDQAFEESLILAHPGEEAELQRGLYTGNAPFHDCESGLWYLNLCTLTMARLYPRPTVRRVSRGGRHDDPDAGGWERVTSPRFRRSGAPLRGDEDYETRRDARVRFLRITFAIDDDMRVVVLLGSQRRFARFVAEHEGMAGMLAQAFAARRW
jgi:hypothetical protein